VWSPAPGNLYASTLVRLRPADPPAATLALVAAVALHEAAGAVARGAELSIKWPNDLLAAGAKLGGILLEREGEAVVIGFGVNLADHPRGLDRPVTSLAALTGSAPDAAGFAQALAAAFAFWLDRWRVEGLAPVRARWLGGAHPVGTALSVECGSAGRVQGLFDGLDETGALRLRFADGTYRTYHSGDVLLV
jgi:BirA family biotin operon repressor/biotin-[acetyl-CoA-carboxylase] ligase